MKVKILLKDGRSIVSRTSDYEREQIDGMLMSIQSNFDMYVEGSYICKGNEVKKLTVEF
ncbi:hypothetical protein MHB43_23715 [Paenibacillus sp. FSL H8-0317]|uniref:hypothetical protein n=1 Tax=Paenibacillus sp. FSL H8-0317 TaxID=2921385 RepID=UPI00324510F7